MIHGVQVKQLKMHCDERGRLMEILRSDDPLFQKFGQVYLTTAYPGVIKAWHYHKKQTDHLVAIHGMVKFVLYDPREDSPSCGQINEFFAGDYNPILIEVPHLIYHGFKCIGDHEAIVVNVPTELYVYAEPDEHRIRPDDPSVPYDWEREDG